MTSTTVYDYFQLKEFAFLLNYVILALLGFARHRIQTIAADRRRSTSIAVANIRFLFRLVPRIENGEFRPARASGPGLGLGPAVCPGPAWPGPALYIHKLPIVRLWRWLFFSSISVTLQFSILAAEGGGHRIPKCGLPRGCHVPSVLSGAGSHRCGKRGAGAGNQTSPVCTEPKNNGFKKDRDYKVCLRFEFFGPERSSAVEFQHRNGGRRAGGPGCI